LVKPVYLVLLLIFGILSFFPNINLYEFRGEESLRTIVAFEMVDSGNFLQPTFLGDLYFNKPPLFNWFIVLSSQFIPWSELTARIISICFVSLTVLLIYIFSYRTFQNKEMSLLSGLLYLVSLDILFWYGYLAEIDATLAFFIFLMFVTQYLGYFEKKDIFVLLSGLLGGFAFLLKGFPAFMFWWLTYFSFVIFDKNFRWFFRSVFLFSMLLMVLVPFSWILSSSNPELYLKRLFMESIVRAEGSSDIKKFVIHLISYPLLNFKQTIPVSLILVIILFSAYKSKAHIKLPKEIKVLILTLFINYIPYLIAVHSKGRYVIPLFPILMVVSGYLIWTLGKAKWIKVVFYTGMVLIVLRFALGFIGFPVLMEKKASRKKVAYDIAQKIDIKRKIACDCKKEKTVCLYIDFLKGEAVKTSRHIPDWDYLIDCSNKDRGKEILSYDLRGSYLKVYKKDDF